MSVTVDTSGRIYDDCISRLLFWHTHREASTLTNELPEVSDQFRFLHSVCLDNFKGSLGLILTKASSMRISIPLDLSSRSCIPLPTVFYTTSFQTIYTTFRSFPCFSSSVFCLIGTWRGNMKGIHLIVLSAFLLVIVVVFTLGFRPFLFSWK